MARIALHSVLRDGREEGYDAAHARIPDDLVAAHHRAGIRDWQIWRSGRHVFHLVDCDDFAAAREALADEPANAAWQAAIGDFVDHFEVAESGEWALPMIWSMRGQVAADTGSP